MLLSFKALNFSQLPHWYVSKLNNTPQAFFKHKSALHTASWDDVNIYFDEIFSIKLTKYFIKKVSNKFTMTHRYNERNTKYFVFVFCFVLLCFFDNFHDFFPLMTRWRQRQTTTEATTSIYDNFSIFSNTIWSYLY